MVPGYSKLLFAKGDEICHHMQTRTQEWRLTVARGAKGERVSFETWVEAIPSRGRYYFMRDEAMAALKLNRKAFNQAAARLSERKRIARIHSTFYVVIPLEHAAVGIIPAEWFIVDLMRHLGRTFYVGVLSASEYHGAAHQKPQTFQVVTDRPLRPIQCRGVGIRSFVKRSVAAVPVQQVKGVTGYIPVSTPEATALDLLRYSRHIGGLNHVLTVLQELGEAIDPNRLAEAAEADGNVAYAQRLGWLFDRTDFAEHSVKLAEWVERRKPFPIKLEPTMPLRGSERDRRWNLWINTEVEGDFT